MHHAEVNHNYADNLNMSSNPDTNLSIQKTNLKNKKVA